MRLKSEIFFYINQFTKVNCNEMVFLKECNFINFSYMKKCLNCGAESESKYCPECGQDLDLKRLEVKTIFHEVTHGILHWENSILKTFRLMLIKPGETVKKYIAGQRKNIVKPFTYFIFIQTIYMLLFHWMSGEYFAFVNFKINMTDALAGKIQNLQSLIGSFINYLNYAMPFLFALFLHLFYKKKTGINFAESIAISLYWIGTTLVFGIILMMMSLIEIGIFNARFIINIIFLVFCILQFTNMRKFRGILKSLLSVVLSYLAYAVFVGLILLIYLIIRY